MTDQRPVCLGHSVGGATVAWAAARHPDRIRAAVLVDPERFHTTPDEHLAGFEAMTKERVNELHETPIEELMEEFPAYLDAEYTRRRVRGIKRCDERIAAISGSPHPPVREALRDIRCPVLVLRRDVGNDWKENEQALDRKLDHVSVSQVPEAGHAVFDDAYDTALEELRQFLEAV